MKKCLIMTMIIGGSLLGSAYTAEAAYTLPGCGYSDKPLCREFGYTKQSTNECATSDYLPCPFGEGYYCKTKNNGTGCVFGSILYDDLKCYTSSNIPSGRVPIGVVFDEVNTLAATLDEKSLKWGWISVDISGIDSSSGDYGKGNTKKIIDAFIAAGEIDLDRDTTYAAGYCYNYTTPGVGRTNWFLPDDATMTKMVDSVSTLNGVLENIASAEELGGSYHASQSNVNTSSSNCPIFRGDSSPWRVESSGCGIDHRSYDKYIRCVINYTDVVGPTPKTCEIGDVVYDDLKCYTIEPEGVTAIGIAVDPSQRLMLGLDVFEWSTTTMDDAVILDGTLSWLGTNQNSLSLQKVLDVNEDLQQKACTEYEVRAGTCSTDAKAVTAMFASEDAILEWLKPIVEEKYGAIGNFKFTDFHNGAPDYCLNYSTAGTSKGDWFIPAADTLVKVFENYDLIESVLTYMGGMKIHDNKYSSVKSYWSTTVTKMPEIETVDYGFFAVSMNFEDKYINLKELQPNGWVSAVDARCVAKY